MTFGDMACQTFLRNTPQILLLCLLHLDLSLNLLADLPSFSFSSLRGVFPKWASYSPGEKPVNCPVPTGSSQTPWPDIHTRWPHLLSSSPTDPVLRQRELCCCARKPTPLMTVHFQMLLPLHGLFILILATRHHLSKSWGFDGIFKREVIPVHTQPALYLTNGSKKVLNECYFDGWVNE